MHKLFHNKKPDEGKNDNINDDGFQYTGPLWWWKTTKERRKVPEHIKKPDYAETGIPQSELLASWSNVIPVYN